MKYIKYTIILYRTLNRHFISNYWDIQLKKIIDQKVVWYFPYAHVWLRPNCMQNNWHDLNDEKNVCSLNNLISLTDNFIPKLTIQFE